MLISTIIMTILSIIFIVATYFGITRYITLQIQSPDKYIENYQNLPKSDNKVNIVIYSVSKNVNNLKSLINSILDQTIRVDRIFLSTIDITYNDLPEYLKNIVTILPVSKNYGQEFANTLLPMLLNEKNADTTIIALKRNIIYGKDFLETIINISEKTPNTAILDNKQNALLVKPNYYDSNIFDRNKDNYLNTWFIEKIPHKYLKYSENYKY
jgi:hypothetical protein